LNLKGPKLSGKTTILKLISKQIFPDKGEIELNGDVITNDKIKKFYENLGYCPQYNSFWNELTVYEILKFYASIRNVNEDIIQNRCRE
jgi:ABC-type multidrug transport system ATPase subunit